MYRRAVRDVLARLAERDAGAVPLSLTSPQVGRRSFVASATPGRVAFTRAG
jgi:hypothetical protein